MGARVRLVLSWIGAAMIGGAVAAAFGGAARPGPDRIRVREVAVVDAAGKERIVLGVDDVATFLEFRDIRGKARCRLDQDDEFGPLLQFFDADGALRLSTGTLKAGEPIMSLRDPRDKTRFAVGVAPDGPYLRLFDEADRMILRAP